MTQATPARVQGLKVQGRPNPIAMGYLAFVILNSEL
jgi:hypothetical protein